jgi:AcrR family transcriptional regulator
VSEVRAASAAATRARLLKAARAVLRTNAELTIDAVAQRAGVARMTVYNQFGSKRGLVEAVADDAAIRGGLGRLGEVFEARGPRDGLHRFVEIFTGFWSCEYAVVRALRARGRVDPEVATSMRDDRRRAIVRRLVDEDDVIDVIVALTSFETYETLRKGRDPSGVAEVIWSAVERLL